MIKHLLLWKYTEEVKRGDTREKTRLLREKYAALPGIIDGLLCSELGEDCSGGVYDLALYCEFRDKDSLARYQQHPLHLEIRDLAKDWVCGRACVDYEV